MRRKQEERYFADSDSKGLVSVDDPDLLKVAFRHTA
jgi:hypothetical protein